MAVSDANTKALELSKQWSSSSVKRYTNADDLINDPNVQAVLIATDTTIHPILTIKAVQAGKHVLLEKPIAVSIADSEPVVEAVKRAQAKDPKLRVMVGFSRRCELIFFFMMTSKLILMNQSKLVDDSYREAFNRKHELGDVFYFHGVTNDQYDPAAAEFFKAYSKVSGSILVDCGIHDTDLARWYIGPEKVKKVFAAGYNARIHSLAESNDVDNAVASIVFESGKLATLHLSRTAIHGHECTGQLQGTNGMYKINTDARMNRLGIYDQHGARFESTQTYYDRFREAFGNEIREFTDACLDPNIKLPVSIDDAMEATKITVGLQMSFRSGQQVFFDENNYPIPPKGEFEFSKL